MTTGHVVHIWLGVRGEDLDPATRKTLGVIGGALVREVVKGSPATRAGIKERDVITTVNGKAITSMADVVVAVRGRKAGDIVKVTIWRAATMPHTFTVTLSAGSPHLPELVLNPAGFSADPTVPDFSELVLGCRAFARGSRTSWRDRRNGGARRRSSLLHPAAMLGGVRKDLDLRLQRVGACSVRRGRALAGGHSGN